MSQEAKGKFLARIEYVFNELVEAISTMPPEDFETMQPTHVTAHFDEYSITVAVTEPGATFPEAEMVWTDNRQQQQLAKRKTKP